MEFYHKVLGGNLDLQTLDERSVSRPAGPGDSIRHARLDLAIALGGTDKGRLSKIFNDLAEGGRIQMPLSKQPWGTEAGWLTDQFGINWTVNINQA
jgi:uncharacterized glyoxalase superfamily protein PhnB